MEQEEELEANSVSLLFLDSGVEGRRDKISDSFPSLLSTSPLLLLQLPPLQQPLQHLQQGGRDRYGSGLSINEEWFLPQTFTFPDFSKLFAQGTPSSFANAIATASGANNASAISSVILAAPAPATTAAPGRKKRQVATANAFASASGDGEGI
ncbi:hypothetical protein PMAYCL1PPCAC_07994 [Pristionchus mayeri]|uniref:Uncharacterized protein n=1 Tax=Pristionchus mayeri TaxID=1317129 RepID=A0AAN4ZE10_9BILA|nr:hypothetical protein PMAYCL1PPCAC_07994 [Pristionchus mayeri]